jgi:hypothetical protein
MKQKNLIICTLLLSIVYSCTTVKVASNKANNYNKKLTKVFVLTQSESKAVKVTDHISRKLMTAFKDKNIEGRFESKNSLSLTTDAAYQNKINAFNPNQLMVIKQTAISYRSPTIIDAISFEINILDYTSKVIIWKGELEIYGQVGVKSSIEKSFRKLIKQLKKDALI